MHEISLVRNIFRTLESEFSPEELKRLCKIKLKVGLLSNVEPILLENAFEAVCQSENRYGNTELEIELLPIEIFCNDCNKRCPVTDYKFVCDCGKPSNQIVQGLELTIHQVQFFQTPDTLGDTSEKLEKIS